jgi:glutamyl-tRNA reductase
MPLVTCGVNHKTAPVQIREQVSFAADRLQEALLELHGQDGVCEASILSTCNRTELYCNLDSPDDTPVVQWLARYHDMDLRELEPYLYRLGEESTVRHMLRVASGLDSMVLGEPQILGQMKSAYQAARDAGTLGLMLGRLYQHTFSVAKEVRTDTAIGASPVSVAFAAVSLARQIFGDFEKRTALLIGAGETIELAARHLHEHGLGRMIIANRSVERAHNLATQFDGYAIGLPEIPAHIGEADIVISSTGSPVPIVSRATVEAALKQRKHRPIFMVDIAVPRDIDDNVAELRDIYLYTVDDLHEVIEENMRSRQEAAEQADEIIDVQIDHFLGWLRSLDAVGVIRAYREEADNLRLEVLDKAQRMLAAGKSPHEALNFLAHTLTNKIIHAPCANLRQACYDQRPELVEAARELFGQRQDDSKASR